MIAVACAFRAQSRTEGQRGLLVAGVRVRVGHQLGAEPVGVIVVDLVVRVVRRSRHQPAPA